MTDDAIRDLLASIARRTFGLRYGGVAAPFGHVQAHGGDLEAVGAWVEDHGGFVDHPRRESRGIRSGRVVVAALTTADHRRFVFPESALTPPP